MSEKMCDEVIYMSSIDFLICCYFGQAKDLYKAAIDRSYRDMASHTLSLKKDESDSKWKYRYDASNKIREYLRVFSKDTIFLEWHENVINEIVGIYKNNLSIGQAQKWLNMVIKYLFVFYTVLPKDRIEKELREFKYVIKNIKEFYVPIDSYVLTETNLKEEYRLWSTLDRDQYEDLNSKLKLYGYDFIWELVNWNSFNRRYDSKSYDYYYEKMNANSI